MKQLTISKVSKLGENDPKYGQTYWAEVDEQNEPVMFNLMTGSVQEGDVVTAEEVLLKTSSKGNDYHRLKKVKVQETNPRQVNTTDIAKPQGEVIDDILKRLAKLEDAVFPEEVEDRNDDPINLDDIPF